MRKVFVVQLVLGALGLTAFASVPLASAVAHEEHKMECNETSINAMNADIQSMSEGEAKTKAGEEMKIAEDMMANQDMEGCMAHMHKAMEVMEE